MNSTARVVMHRIDWGSDELVTIRTNPVSGHNWVAFGVGHGVAELELNYVFLFKL